MLAYLALTDDEPIEFALDYISSAYERMTAALSALRDDRGQRLVPAAVEDQLSGIALFLLGLSQSADPEAKTQYNLVFKRPKGRPKKTIVDVNLYRDAARLLNRRKAEVGYHSAVAEVVDKTGLDRSKLQAWASHLEREAAALNKYAD